MKVLFTIALVAIMFLSTVEGFEQGDYFSYSYVFTSDGGEAVSGGFSVSVVDVLSDGRLRIRSEATFNDGVATLEKNLPSSYFSPPSVDLAAYEGVYSYRRGNLSLELSVEKVGKERRTVSGFEYVTEVYRVTASVGRDGDDSKLEGVIETITPSKVLYSLDLIHTGPGGKRTSLQLTLETSNIDLSAFNTTRVISPTELTAIQASFLSGLPPSAGQFFEMSDRVDVAKEPSTSSSGYFDRIWVVLAAGLATIAAVSFLSMRRKGTATEPGEKKAHYV
ncbi:MAG: hypothetical protein QXE96_05675 [Candidatus Caldarchaeum sp.]